MKKQVLVVFVALLSLALMASVASAQAAKNAVQVNEAAIVDATCDAAPPAAAWSDIARVNIHTSALKDLVMGASLETILFTDTLVKSAGGTKDTSTAEALLKVRVTVDGVVEARPGVVVFDKRFQSLMARFNGICTDANGDGIVQFTECTQPEELELILDTMAAHAFNFILEDVGVGDHQVVMQGCVKTATTSQEGSATAKAAAGKGSLTVEEVRLIKGQDVVFP